MTVGRTYRLSYAIEITAMGFPGGFSIGFGDTDVDTDAGKSYTATKSAAADYFDFVYKGTTTHAKLFLQAAVSSSFTVYLDNFSLKEVGTATGWTDADQQLDIAQPALQSYNELAWFPGVDLGTSTDYDIKIDTSSSSPIDNVWVGGGTASAWIFVNGMGAGGHGRVFDKYYWRVFLTTLSGDTCKLEFQHYRANQNHATAIDNHNIKLGEWNHIAITYDKSSPSTAPKIYINGVLQDTTSTDYGGGPGGLGDPSNDALVDLYIGNKDDGSRTFDGCITEASLWANTLTATEVLELYNEGKALDATLHSSYVSAASNLKGYWRNNGLSTWTDLSDNSNNGAVNNLTETLLIPQGVDGSRDAQGFIMNRERDTSSLNLNANKIVDALGEGDMVKVENVELGTTDFSICFWAYKFRDWNQQWVLSQHTGDKNRWYVRGSSGNPPALHIYAKIGDTEVLSDTDSTSLDGAAYLDNWMHVALTVDRSDTSNGIQWYINGEATSNSGVVSDQTGTSLSLTSNLTIGGNEDESFDDHHFDGKIDGVLIYTDKLLSGPEVLRNYNATKGSHR
jgi:hypothetical protein